MMLRNDFYDFFILNNTVETLPKILASITLAFMHLVLVQFLKINFLGKLNLRVPE